MAKLLEKFPNVTFTAFIWDVFDVNVVNESPHLPPVLWLELHLVNAVGNVELQCLNRSMLLLKANEAIASRRVIRVDRNLEALDPACLREDLVELLVFEILGHLDKNIMIQQPILIATKQLLIKRQCATLLPIDVKVLHFLTSLFELLGVFYVDHSRIKRPGNISLDLRLRFQNDSGLFFESEGNLIAADLILGQVVEVNEVSCEIGRAHV